jgi:hypothetical protein
MFNFSNTFIKKFSTKVESPNQLYGYILREKFAAICRADLVSKVLNKTENDTEVTHLMIVSVKRGLKPSFNMTPLK